VKLSTYKTRHTLHCLLPADSTIRVSRFISAFQRFRFFAKMRGWIFYSDSKWIEVVL